MVKQVVNRCTSVSFIYLPQTTCPNRPVVGHMSKNKTADGEHFVGDHFLHWYREKSANQSPETGRLIQKVRRL